MKRKYFTKGEDILQRGKSDVSPELQDAKQPVKQWKLKSIDWNCYRSWWIMVQMISPHYLLSAVFLIHCANFIFQRSRLTNCCALSWGCRTSPGAHTLPWKLVSEVGLEVFRCTAATSCPACSSRTLLLLSQELESSSPFSRIWASLWFTYNWETLYDFWGLVINNRAAMPCWLDPHSWNPDPLCNSERSEASIL